TALGDTQSYGAKSVTFGTGCAGSNGTPALDATDAPRLGANFDLNATNVALTGHLAIFSPRLTRLAPAPLDCLGMIGCPGDVAPTVLTSVTATAGSATLSLPIPATIALMGTTVNSQVLSLDPNINPVWLTTSNGHSGTIG